MKLENVTVLDYVDDMAALMHGCDLAILKSGGLTVTECLCAHLPMILLGKSYGQEKANTTMLTGMGASMHVTTARELIVTLRHLHDHPESLKALLINGEVLRRPRAAEDIAIATMELAGKPQKRKRAFCRFYWGRKTCAYPLAEKFAARREPPIYHPCSNILASLRSLRNCAWNDMCERWAGVYSLENNNQSFLICRCDKGSIPLPHLLTAINYFGSPLQLLI